MCLLLCQYHIALITVALHYSLKSRSIIPPVLFFFLKLVWLFLYKIFKLFAIVCEKCLWHFDRVCTKLYIFFLMNFSSLIFFFPWMMPFGKLKIKKYHQTRGYIGFLLLFCKTFAYRYMTHFCLKC